MLFPNIWRFHNTKFALNRERAYLEILKFGLKYAFIMNQRYATSKTTFIKRLMIIAVLHIEAVVQRVPSNLLKCTVLPLLHWMWSSNSYCAIGSKNLGLLSRQPPLGGDSEGIYEHPAYEQWASRVSKLWAWDQNGPHRSCTYHTPRDTSRLQFCT